MKNKIIIVSGDPNSINSELIFKSWKKIENSVKKRIYIISNYNLLKKQFAKLNYSIDMVKVQNLADNENTNKLKIINVDINFKNPFKIKQTVGSKFIKESFTLAHKLSLNRNVNGLINCPINKILLNKGKIGVTEYLAFKCNVKNGSEVMLIKGKKFSVSPITTHIDIKDIAKNINQKIITNKVKTINNWFTKYFKKKVKIAILGLNPHNGELRKNSEEKKIIMPSILKLKKLFINIKGPFVADTIFIKDYKNYDVIIGMYHDQVLAPFKTLCKFEAINITLGLKYLRVSPDHGVAFDLIGKNKADPKSLLYCIDFVNKFKK